MRFVLPLKGWYSRDGISGILVNFPQQCIASWGKTSMSVSAPPCVKQNVVFSASVRWGPGLIQMLLAVAMLLSFPTFSLHFIFLRAFWNLNFLEHSLASQMDFRRPQKFQWLCWNSDTQPDYLIYLIKSGDWGYLIPGLREDHKGNDGCRDGEEAKGALRSIPGCPLCFCSPAPAPGWAEQQRELQEGSQGGEACAHCWPHSIHSWTF